MKAKPKAAKKVTDEDRAAFIAPFVDKDKVIIKKIIKILHSYQYEF